MALKTPITNCKYSEWLKDYNFENCKLNRGEYGEFLANYITGEHDGFVLNLNGGWGTGKTQFLRRLYSLLCSKGHPTIYIDAWESDFSENPLSVVSSELVSQLSSINQHIGSDLKKVSRFLGKALKGATIASAGFVSKIALGEASVGTELSKSILGKSDLDFLEQIKQDHTEQIDAIKNIKSELECLAEVIQTNYKHQLPVVVLVDELDRCRPNYAIEMLEVIKHFFTTKNFVFVIATDTEQLQHSIKAIYGSGFDSSVYLKRFFDREATLDVPDLEVYVNMQSLDSLYDSKGIELYPKISKHLSKDSFNDYICWIAKVYNLRLRDIDQLLSKMKACLRYAENEHNQNGVKQYINIFTLLLVLAEMDSKQFVFKEHNDHKYSETLNEMHNFQVSKPLYHGDEIIKFYDFASLMVHCSKVYEVNLDDAHPRGHISTILGAHRFYSSKIARTGEMSISAFNEIRTIYEQYLNDSNDSRSRFWLWDDYIKVSNLAGWID